MYGKMFSDQTATIYKKDGTGMIMKINAVYSYQNKKRNETHKSVGLFWRFHLSFTKDMHKQSSAV